jgi:hypothetical protein
MHSVRNGIFQDRAAFSGKNKPESWARTLLRRHAGELIMNQNLVQLEEADLETVNGGNMIVRFLLELAATYALEGIASSGPDTSGYNLGDLNAP